MSAIVGIVRNLQLEGGLQGGSRHERNARDYRSHPLLKLLSNSWQLRTARKVASMAVIARPVLVVNIKIALSLPLSAFLTTNGALAAILVISLEPLGRRILHRNLMTKHAWFVVHVRAHR
jgi:hypothetical protein